METGSENKKEKGRVDLKFFVLMFGEGGMGNGDATERMQG